MWKRKLTSVQCAKCRRRLMVRRYRDQGKQQILDRGKWRKGQGSKKSRYVCLRCRHGGKKAVFTTFGFA